MPSPFPLHLLLLLLILLPQPCPATVSPKAPTPPSPPAQPGSRFFRRRPSDAAIEAYLESIAASGATFNHGRVGETRPATASSEKGQRRPPPAAIINKGWRVVRLSVPLGKGAGAYRAGRDALRAWRMHEGSADTGACSCSCACHKGIVLVDGRGVWIDLHPCDIQWFWTITLIPQASSGRRPKGKRAAGRTLRSPHWYVPTSHPIPLIYHTIPTQFILPIL